MLSLFLALMNCVLLQPAPAQPPTDKPGLFKESLAQWKDYEKKTEKLQCSATTKTLLNDKLTGETQTTGVRSPEGFVQVVRVTFPEDASEEAAYTSRTRPEIVVARNKGAYFEVFSIAHSTTNAKDFPDINLSTLNKKTGWIVRSENVAPVDEYAYPGDYPARNNFKIHDGFRNAPGTITYVEWLYSKFINVTNVKSVDNKLIITFTNDAEKGDIRRVTGGTITLLKDQNWLVSDCELDYVKQPVGGWTTEKLTVAMKYTNLGGVSVPVSREETTNMVNKDGVKRVTKTTTAYTVTKLDNDKAFALTSFGLPERNLAPPAAPSTEAAAQPAVKPYVAAPQPFTSLETIPLWAWLSTGCIAVVVLAILIMIRPVKAKASS